MWDEHNKIWHDKEEAWISLEEIALERMRKMVISRVLSRWFLSWGIVWTMVGYLNESLAYILLGAVFIGLGAGLDAD